MTSIDDVIQPGQPIPDDVTAATDRDGTSWAAGPSGWYCTEFWDAPPTSPWGFTTGDFVLSSWGPLTVTAVREQPAESVSGLCEVGTDKVTCIVMDADHRRIYHGGLPLEPQQADASPVLDLVRQYGELNAAAALYPKSSAPAQADALFARIAALVPQQPVQARGRRGSLWWIHPCGTAMSSPDTPGSVHNRIPPCDKPGPWLQLLVGGDPAPELARDSHEPHADGPREPSAQERADHELMAALGVEQIGEVIPAIEHLKALVDHLRNWRSEHDKRERERDAARAEVERLTVELAVEREAEERGNAELKDIVRRLDEAGVNNGGASERVGYAIQSMRQGWATARNHLASLDTVKSDRETIRGSLNHLKDTVTGPAIELLGVQHNEDIVPAIERLKAEVRSETEISDEYAGWASKLAHAAIERLDAPVTEEAHTELWELALHALEAPAAPPDPLVLGLPEGAVALIGGKSGRRFTRVDRDGPKDWWNAEDGRQSLGSVMDLEGTVRVVLGPPSEPVGQADTVHADGSHTYWSTHCRHGNHEACSATSMVRNRAARGPAEAAPRPVQVLKAAAQCKTCAAPCICPCHEQSRVELAPPREPRTWSKLDPVPDDLRHVRGASGTVYARTPGTFAFSGYRNGESVTRNLHILREEDGPLDEVLK
jgi:hypothetical protein